MQRNYSFPMEPYEVQIEFMNNLYDCLQNCKGGLFESPTGTGKSLSIICGSLTFLTDYYKSKLEETISDSSTSKKFKYDLSGMGIPELKHRVQGNSSAILPAYKILYLSRTHSQLNQFINELKRTKWNTTEKIRVVRLGSRVQLCINAKALENKASIDFTCKSLTKHNKDSVKGSSINTSGSELNMNASKKSKSPKGCEYFDKQDNAKGYLLANICDIEDLVTAGKQLKACPYYATRAAIKDADVIVAPYSSILNKHNRNLIGVNLNECYVIVDESHNLIDAISEYHSASITKKQLLSCRKAFKNYYNAFRDLMFPRKAMYVTMAIDILEKTLDYIGNNYLAKTTDDRDEFISKLHLETIDFFSLWDFIEEEQLITKIHDHCEYESFDSRADTNTLKTFADFILCLNENEGKVLLSRTGETDTLKFLLLNPMKKFQKMLSESVNIILCGGTLTPNQEFLNLFSSLPSDQLKHFSCDHVIPSENLILCTIQNSPNNKKFKFVYENRNNLELLQELGQTIIDISCAVPNGMVVFLPSYLFLNKLQMAFEGNILKKMSMRKRVFFDSRNESALKEYSDVACNSGAILFTVCRGALSEGINFSDKLGRCVIIVGMPYLNNNDLEVSVKMDYYNKHGNGYTGQDFYENSCHITINQSIGRAIRHIKDFAVVILIDSRHHSCINKRPSWMMKSFISQIPYDKLLHSLRTFFRSKINLNK